MVTVYGMRESGNCYKVALLLEQLGQAYRWRETDIMKGASRTPEFLAMNSNGRIPVLEIAAGDWLAESNAILCYLAEQTPLLPAERRQRAAVLQWLFFEQYSHEPYIAVARFISVFLAAEHWRRAELPALRERGYQALGVMERHLGEQDFFAGRYSIADIALFAYTCTASDGGYDLGSYPGILGWLDRVRGQEGFIEAKDIGKNS